MSEYAWIISTADAATRRRSSEAPVTSPAAYTSKRVRAMLVQYVGDVADAVARVAYELSTAPKTPAEPKLRCYVTASCRSRS